MFEYSQKRFGVGLELSKEFDTWWRNLLPKHFCKLFVIKSASEALLKAGECCCFCVFLWLKQDCLCDRNE